nr:helix-turn-helix transcriptional regulator [Frigoribacterium sp. VKM Ac-2530]
MNGALASQIHRERVSLDHKLSVRALGVKAGISPDTLKRQLNNDRDMTMTQIAQLARALDLAPEELVRRAIENAGGMDALTADSEGVSEASGTNVTSITRGPMKPLTTEQIDETEKRAATNDPEMDTDEQFD